MTETRITHGLGVSPGLAKGPAVRLQSEHRAIDNRRLDKTEVESEIESFHYAVRRSRDEIFALKEILLADQDDPGVRVLDAHLLILEDDSFLRDVQEVIRTQLKPAATAVTEVLSKTIALLEASSSEYFRGRTADIRDVERRTLRHLDGGTEASHRIPDGAVLVVDDISPSEAAALDPDRIGALLIDHGGATSHAAILARSRGIPAVVGLRDLSKQLGGGELVLVDGESGEVTIDPEEETIEGFLLAQRRAQRRTQVLEAAQGEPAITEDGAEIRLCANVETAADLAPLPKLHCDGIGLFRTEYYFLERNELPDEELQYESYRQVVEGVYPAPVTIRVLDVGGDKFAGYFGMTRAENPFLGVRGIRFLLAHPEIFRTQVRAILRAAVHGKVRILFPLITSVDEMQRSNAVVEEERDRLLSAGVPVPPIPRGAMIETPAAALLLDLLAAEADFFSIGSNDLVQYTLAVDRGDDHVSHLYDPFHPAVLRCLRGILRDARTVERPASSCGEMSGDPAGAALLLGLGCLHLSLSPAQIPRIKSMIRHCRLADLERLAQRVLQLSSGEEVRAELIRALGPVLEVDE